MHAGNVARLEQGFRDIAEKVKLAGRKDPQADIFQLVHGWPQNEKNKWLLILDNVDDACVLSLSSSSGNSGRRHLSSYLAPSQCGSILVTSRNRAAASHLVEENDIIPVVPMLQDNTEALLEKKLGDAVDNDGIVELTETLEYMPLALVQAATYIRRRVPRCSIRQYLEIFSRTIRKDEFAKPRSGTSLSRLRGQEFYNNNMANII